MWSTTESFSRTRWIGELQCAGGPAPTPVYLHSSPSAGPAGRPETGRRTKKGEGTPRNRIRPLPALFLPPQTTRMVRCSSHTCMCAACARRVVTLYKIETCIDVRSSISVHTPAERTYARGLRIRTHWYNYRRQLATEVGLACKY
jgi:hypothetical protein